jgi:hypothetical protein
MSLSRSRLSVLRLLEWLPSVGSVNDRLEGRGASDEGCSESGAPCFFCRSSFGQDCRPSRSSSSSSSSSSDDSSRFTPATLAPFLPSSAEGAGRLLDGLPSLLLPDVILIRPGGRGTAALCLLGLSISPLNDVCGPLDSSSSSSSSSSLAPPFRAFFTPFLCFLA